MSQTASPAVQRCPRCGEENPPRFRLCGFCGAALTPKVSQEVRKTVTIVFCDLKGSTSLAERLPTETLRAVLNRYFEAMRAAIERHGGSVEKYIGDAVVAVFGFPRVREDDSLRAVRAAFDMVSALEKLNVELERTWAVTLANRIGVNTGEVVSGDVSAGQRLVTGDAVNVAARLEQAADEMTVLIGEATYSLVRDAVDVETPLLLELKGKSAPVAAYRLISVSGDMGRVRRHDAPMVGRGAELAALERAFAAAARDRRCLLFTILGHAGAGKSRLVLEFARSAGAVRILSGRCLPYGEGVTFWPLAEMIRDAAAITETDSPQTARARIEELLRHAAAAGNGARAPSLKDPHAVADRVAAAAGLSATEFRVEELFWGIRGLFEALASNAPLVLVFDDLHWAEPTLLDLIEYLTASETGGAILVLGMARPDLLEERPGWRELSAGGVILLEPLTDAEASQVAENLLGSAGLPGALRTRVVRAAEGNPLFVEQLLSMLVDEGFLRQDADGAWVQMADATSFDLPPTIAALLTARLERLTDVERAVLERAAVIGPVFSRRAIEAMEAQAIIDHVEPALSSLIGKEMVHHRAAEPSASERADAYRFNHILIQEAAYGSLLRRSRAELHEAYADHLQRTSGERAAEQEEILGFHLEQAYLSRAAIGVLDDHGLSLGARASERLAAAGRRALARGDASAAARLLERATATVPAEGRARAELLPWLAQAQTESGDFLEAERTVHEATTWAGANGDDLLGARALEIGLYLAFLAQAPGWNETVVAEITRILPIFEGAGDHRALARAWALMGYVHGTASRFTDAEREVGRALEHARLAGDRREEARSLSAYAQSALYGRLPVPAAIERCEALLDEARGDHRAESIIMLALSRLYAMAGEFERARELYGLSRSISEDLGVRLHAALTSIDSGPVELLAGNLDAAERELSRDLHALESMGERAYLSTTAAWLAQVMVEAHRPEEAEELCALSQASASADDVETQMLWRCALAKVLATRGRFDEAVPLSGEAIALIESADQPDAQGMALADHGRVLRMAGRAEDAARAFERAIERFDLKGSVVARSRAQEMLAETVGAR
jgi:class 3 adenylate cyclase/tetratricopeptide (TPR) repeat protein